MEGGRVMGGMVVGGGCWAEDLVRGGMLIRWRSWTLQGGKLLLLTSLITTVSLVLFCITLITLHYVTLITLITLHCVTLIKLNTSHPLHSLHYIALITLHITFTTIHFVTRITLQ